MSASLITHTNSHAFDIIDSCLCVGGSKITDIVKELDCSPFYLYDSDLIKARVRFIRDSLPEGIKLHYAIKANPMPALVQLVTGLVDGLDVASGGELNISLATGCPPADISFAGPGKTVVELEAAVKAGVTLNVNPPPNCNDWQPLAIC